MKRHTQRIVKSTDKLLVPLMKRLGHRTERYLLSVVFIWFGSLKLLGQTSATSIIAKSIYWIEPSIVIPALGIWEIGIGLCLMFRPTLRIALLLLFIRLPGTILAFFYHFHECFDGAIWLPTIQGQYLIKDLTLLGAALVIGSTIQSENQDS